MRCRMYFSPRLTFWASLAAYLLMQGQLRADVTLAPLFRDHAVIQRDKPVSVWGRGDANEPVQVHFAGHTSDTVADDDGHWRVQLAPSPASASPTDLVVTGHNTVIVHDVVVGEVWLCSGQSNMAMTVGNSANADTEIAAGNHPLIRQFKVSLAIADTPQETVGGNWTAASPETVGNFTAVGYYFARELSQTLGMPIGLINATQGGSPIEAWIPAETLAGNTAFAVVAARWQAALDTYPAAKPAYDVRFAEWEAASAGARAAGHAFKQPKPWPPPGPGSFETPSSLYQGMIHPLIPYAIRGTIWYQGESNSGRDNEYPALFSAMITAWRERFGQGNFPFYWVQLPNYTNPYDNSGVAWAWLREAQTRALALPATGMVVTIDTADPADLDNIHPRNKQPVGRRLALLAEAQTYGKAVPHLGPRFASASPTGAAVRVEFRLGDGGRLIAPGNAPHGFEIAGGDHVFHPANARITDTRTVIVTADSITIPVALRYAWRNSPDATLADGSGFPAAPFRTDNWQRPTIQSDP